MNVLFLTQVLPYPLDAGPKVRAHYMLRHLAGRHRVTLVSFVRPDDRPEYVAHLRDIAAEVHTVPIRRSAWRNLAAGVKGLLTGLPVAIVRDEMPEMGALLRRLVAETPFDVIHADQLSMASWGLLAAGASPHRPKTLLDEHNAIYKLTERIAAESVGLARLIARREARAFRRYEAAMLRAYDAVLAVTEEDRALLEALLAEDRGQESGVRGQGAEVRSQESEVRSQGSGVRGQRSGVRGQGPEDIVDRTSYIPHSTFDIPHSTFDIRHSTFDIRHSTFHIPHSTFDITVLPICADPEAVQPIRDPQSTIHNPPAILHLGTMFWPPNVAGVLWFAREVLPLVWRDAPDARFVIVGKNPPAEVRALAADPRVVVTGYVADPTPYLAEADAFVVPLFSGGGMRVKIVDAWLWGLPVVSTPIGAEGIEVQDGENILIAADAASFAAAVTRVLTDPDLNCRLRVQGRRWVEARYNWRVVYQQVDAVYERLTETQPA